MFCLKDMTIDISGYIHVWPNGLRTLNVSGVKMRVVHLYSACNYTRVKFTVLVVVIRTFSDSLLFGFVKQVLSARSGITKLNRFLFSFFLGGPEISGTLQSQDVPLHCHDTIRLLPRLRRSSEFQRE